MADPVRLAIVGAGGIAQSHLRGYKMLKDAGYDRFEITAVCDVNAENATATAEGIEKSFGGARPRVFAQVEEMIEAGVVDGADLCLPHAYHHTLGGECLRGGIHVLIEKPVGITIKATHKLIEARGERDLVIAGAEQVRRGLPSRAIHWAVRERGMIGEPRFFTQEVFSFNPLDRSTYKFGWRALKSMGGGGMLVDAGVHFSDMVQYVFGPVETAICTMRTIDETIINIPDVPPQPVDVEDYWIASMIFESGLTGHWSWSQHAPGRKLSTRMYYGSEGCLADRQEWMHPFQFGADLIRKDGSELSYEEIEKQYLDSLSQDEKDQLFPYGITDPFAIECWDFVEAISQPREPEFGPEEALRAKALCFALYESSELGGQPVSGDDVRSGKVVSYEEPIYEYWKI